MFPVGYYVDTFNGKNNTMVESVTNESDGFAFARKLQVEIAFVDEVSQTRWPSKLFQLYDSVE